MKKFLKRFWKNEDGVETIELVVIVAVLMGVAMLFRRQITGFVNTLTGELFKVPEF